MKLTIDFPNSTQKFNMGGPYTGPLLINGSRLKYEYLDNHRILSSNGTIMGFVRFESEIKKLQILFSLVKSNYYTKKQFRIVLFKQIEDIWLVSSKCWSSLFLTEISGDRVYFTEAFHDEDMQRFPVKNLKINTENFMSVNQNEIFE